jgi:HAD superfamily hydrolase (TIGR01509 family)
MTKVLLTDIDRTLVDSNSLHAESWRRTFEHFGIEVGLDEAWSQIGKGGDQLIPVFVPAEERERLEGDIKRYREDLMKREYMPRMVAFRQARSLLGRVRKGGMRIVLATSAKDDDLASYKRLVGMGDLVDEEATSSDAKESKPEADIFAGALKKAGARPEDAVALGDIPYDAEAAGKLGIPTIGLTCGGWKRRDLLGAGCVQVFRDPGHLLAEFAHSVLAGEEGN